jgi:hypothetical protein
MGKLLAHGRTDSRVSNYTNVSMLADPLLRTPVRHNNRHSDTL